MGGGSGRGLVWEGLSGGRGPERSVGGGGLQVRQFGGTCPQGQADHPLPAL